MTGGFFIFVSNKCSRYIYQGNRDLHLILLLEFFLDKRGE